MYNSLPKRRKIATLDPFAVISTPKSKKFKFKKKEEHENKNKFNILSSAVTSSSSAATSPSPLPPPPLFDESQPYFLIDDNLELTEKPLVPVLQYENLNISQQQKRKKNHDYPLLPKIPSQIRWNQIRFIFLMTFD